VNRRQRKKRHVGEFVDLGFHVRGTLKLPVPVGEHGADDAFHFSLTDVFRDRRLEVGGGGRPGTFGYYATAMREYVARRPGPRRNPTEEDRQAVIAHLAADERVDHFEVGPLADAWRSDSA
jgi:uncharacterized protein YggL (DUF469 family)